jgi:hypothetical protein
LVSQCEKQRKGKIIVAIGPGEHQPLYLAVKNGVELIFNDDETRLTKIRLTNNKLSELLKNNVCNSDSIFKINEIVLITRSKFYTEIAIGEVRQSSLSGVNVRISSPLIEDYQQINLNQLTCFEFHVCSDQNISKSKLYTLKQIANREKEDKKQKQKKKKIYYARAKSNEDSKRKE